VPIVLSSECFPPVYDDSPPQPLPYLPSFCFPCCIRQRAMPKILVFNRAWQSRIARLIIMLIIVGHTTLLIHYFFPLLIIVYTRGYLCDDNLLLLCCTTPTTTTTYTHSLLLADPPYYTKLLYQFSRTLSDTSRTAAAVIALATAAGNGHQYMFLYSTDISQHQDN